MERKYEGECDICNSVIVMTIVTDDEPTSCPCCGSEVEYEEMED
jgi:rRNA maturation endonuclease Nob1